MPIKPAEEASLSDRSPFQRYEVRVSGHLGSRWAAWFDGFALAVQKDGTTVISGPMVDQTALHGLLAKLRDLGIPLVSVTQPSVEEFTESFDLNNIHPSHNSPGATP